MANDIPWDPQHREEILARLRAERYAAYMVEFHTCRGCGRPFSILPDTRKHWCTYCSTLNTPPFLASDLG